MEDDTTAPTIASISPDRMDEGVYEDEAIVIQFSEAMDKAQTQAAFQSADIPGVTFSWNASGDSGQAANAWYRCGLSFELSSIPAEMAVLQSAVLSADQSQSEASTFHELGTINVHDFDFAARNLANFSSPGTKLGTFGGSATWAHAVRSFEVTAEVESDFASEGVKGDTQFMLEFTDDSDYDDTLDTVHYLNPTLEVNFLVP